MTPLYLINAAVLVCAATSLWLASLPLRDASIVDRFWGMYFVVVAGVSLVYSGVSTHGALLLALTTIWGVRLSLYLTWRNWGGGEDYRYQAMRRHWGARFSAVSLFTVFFLQAALAWVVSLPLQTGIHSDDQALPEVLVWIGTALWVAGLMFETIGDRQLARFKADPANAGRVMDRGLWRYTRHPNYFGDAIVWWGLYIVSVAASGAWWTAIGPVLMTYLLMRVSGVPMLERKLKKTRPAYTDYATRTSAFFPRPPRA